MSNEEKFQASEAEIEILQVLWEHQPNTVRFIHEQLSLKKQVGYTTTLKQLQRMMDKGLVKRVRTEGKVHFYEAQVKKANFQQRLINKLVDSAFKGSSMDLVMRALGGAETSAEELDALEQFLQQKRKDSNG